MSISVTFPFALSTGSVGYLESSDSIIDAIRSNVQSLLLTNWGERVMHFDFGCNFREFLFEQQAVSLKVSIASRVKSQLAKWMPFLQLESIFVAFSSEDPSVPDPGFRVRLEISYGNVPINLLVNFPIA
jgi:phage baseplate assembly protein W